MSVASQERTISAQLQQRAHNKAQPSCSRMLHNWKQYPQFRHLVLKALLRGIGIWSVNIRGTSWQRNKDKPCYLGVVMETQKKISSFNVGFTTYIHSIGPHQVFVLQIRTFVWYMLQIHCWHLRQFMLAPKILEEEMKIIRGKWLGFKIHRIQA